MTCVHGYAEYGYMMKITEKSDVYSYGVVVLEVLTGKQPIDPTIPDGLHIVDWVRQRRGRVEVLAQSMCGRPESETEEMLQTLGVALLCVNPLPDERPTMKDVAAMLKEIRQEREDCMKVDHTLLLDDGSHPANMASTTLGLPSRSNDSSFSGSSLLYTSSSVAKTGFK